MLAFMKTHSQLSLWIFLKAWCLGKDAGGLPIVHPRDHNMQPSICLHVERHQMLLLACKNARPLKLFYSCSM